MRQALKCTIDIEWLVIILGWELCCYLSTACPLKLGILTGFRLSPWKISSVCSPGTVLLSCFPARVTSRTSRFVTRIVPSHTTPVWLWCTPRGESKTKYDLHRFVSLQSLSGFRNKNSCGRLELPASEREVLPVQHCKVHVTVPLTFKGLRESETTWEHTGGTSRKPMELEARKTISW